jgi:hypothetical protein
VSQITCLEIARFDFIDTIRAYNRVSCNKAYCRLQAFGSRLSHVKQRRLGPAWKYSSEFWLTITPMIFHHYTPGLKLWTVRGGDGEVMLKLIIMQVDDIEQMSILNLIGRDKITRKQRQMIPRVLLSTTKSS